MNDSEQIFWLDDWKGKAKDGCFTRCNLNYCIKHFNTQFKTKVVGIKLDLSSKWNLELLIEEPEEEQ